MTKKQWAGQREYQRGDRHKRWRREYRATLLGRSRVFRYNFPDCVSSLLEVAAAYAAGKHVITGELGKIGNAADDLVLHHVRGGPVVGLIYNWENRIMSERALAHWETLSAIRKLHLSKVG